MMIRRMLIGALAALMATVGGLAIASPAQAIPTTCSNLGYDNGRDGVTDNDANGVEYQTSVRPVGTMLDGTVPEGESIVGHIAFEAPPNVADSGTFQLEIPSPEGSDLLHWTY